MAHSSPLMASSHLLFHSSNVYSWKLFIEYYKSHCYYLEMDNDNEFEGIVAKDNPYYELLQKTIIRCQGIFEVKESDHVSPIEASFPLKMYCRQNEEAKYATFIYFYTVPVKPQDYIKLTCDLDFQKKIETYLDEFKIYKDLQVPNTDLLFKSYKKVLIVMPRYFIYVRYQFVHQGDHWILAVSDPHSEDIKNKTKGEIIITATRVREVEGGSQISVYSQTDMKMALKFETSKNKGFTELKKYLQKIHAALKGE